MSRFLFFLLLAFPVSSFAVNCEQTNILDIFIAPAYALTDPCNPPHYDCVDSPFYQTDGVSFADMLGGKVESFKQTALIQFIYGFFSTTTYGTCEPLYFQIDWLNNWSYTMDLICSSDLAAAFSSLSYVFLLLASFYAIRLVFF